MNWQSLEIKVFYKAKENESCCWNNIHLTLRTLKPKVMKLGFSRIEAAISKRFHGSIKILPFVE